MASAKKWEEILSQGALSPPLLPALTEEQQAVLAAAEAGESFFFTGSAGVGKSYVTNVLIEHLRRKYGPASVFVTASTGIAATHIGGTTLHAFAGMGIDISDMDRILKRVARNRAQWERVRVLFIDEISMVDARFFTALDIVARKMRKSGAPFGGIQLIVTGDFLQLPPVPSEPPSGMLFECNAWQSAISRVLLLSHVHRQRNAEFIDVLQRIRMGEVTDDDDALLRGRVNAPLADNGIIPTMLYTHKSSVEEENVRNLEALEGDELVFAATDSGSDQYAREGIEKHCLAPAMLRLKKGAQVMLLQNLAPPALVNGSRGVVVGVREGRPLVRFESGVTQHIAPHVWQTKKGDTILAQRRQFPLCLAWALTIHKCQGMTLDKVRLDISRCFAPGQAYVALSRCTTLEGISLIAYNRRCISADRRAVQFYAGLGDAAAQRRTRKETRATGEKRLRTETTNAGAQQKKRVETPWYAEFE